MAYLITCSGSKRTPPRNAPGSLEALSFHEVLGDARKNLIRESGVQLNWEDTLPAWQLYSGSHAQLYGRVASKNWQKPETNVLILSALFGWIRHTDRIPNYDLKMQSFLPSIGRPYLFWREQGLLDKLIGPDDVDLLSQAYRKAFHAQGVPVASVPDHVFTGRGANQGKWLNRQLDSLKC